MTRILCLLFAVTLFSCKHVWTQKEKETFMGGCVNGALKDMGEAKARAYCSCMLEKLQKRYPSASDLKYARTDTAVYSMGKDCMK